MKKRFLSGLLSLGILLSSAGAVFAQTPEPTGNPAVTTQPTPAPAVSPSGSPEPLQAMPEATLLPTSIPPEETASPTSAPTTLPEPTQTPILSNTLELLFDVPQVRMPIPSTAYFTLYAGDQAYPVSAELPGNGEPFSFQLELPAYPVGTVFRLVPEGGMTAIQYYDQIFAPGSSIDLITYTYIPEGQTEPIANTAFAFSCLPLSYKNVDLFVDYKPLAVTQPARLINGVAMIPVIEVAKAIGIEEASYYKDYNSVRIAVGNKELLLNLNTTYATRFGETLELPEAPVFIGSTIFAPARTLTDAFGSELIFQDEGTHYNINFGQSAVAKAYYDQIGKAYVVNERGISSQTDYLVWVSKSEYMVRVYQGSQGNWRLVKSFQCAIGTDATPTCTGEYRYYSRESRWSYSSYYCGPIMRFNGGYAIHSTLIQYDGTPYDNRVGMKLSHGCVRVRPENINWMVNTVPLYSKIYITP